MEEAKNAPDDLDPKSAENRRQIRWLSLIPNLPILRSLVAENWNMKCALILGRGNLSALLYRISDWFTSYFYAPRNNQQELKSDDSRTNSYQDDFSKEERQRRKQLWDNYLLLKYIIFISNWITIIMTFLRTILPIGLKILVIFRKKTKESEKLLKKWLELGCWEF